MRAVSLVFGLVVAVGSLAGCKKDDPIYEDAAPPIDAPDVDGMQDLDAMPPDAMPDAMQAANEPGRILSGAGRASGGTLSADIEVGPAIPAARASGDGTTVEIESVTSP